MVKRVPYTKSELAAFLLQGAHQLSLTCFQLVASRSLLMVKLCNDIDFLGLVLWALRFFASNYTTIDCSAATDANKAWSVKCLPGGDTECNC